MYCVKLKFFLYSNKQNNGTIFFLIWPKTWSTFISTYVLEFLNQFTQNLFNYFLCLFGSSILWIKELCTSF